MAIPSVTATEVATLKRHTDPGYKAQAQRLYDFTFGQITKDGQQETIILLFAKASWQGAVGGAVVGGTIGAAVGFPLGASLYLAKAGAAVGGAVGAGLCIRQEIVQIKRSGIYDLWQAEATAKAVYPIFQKYIHEENLEQFICPLSGSLIQSPIRDPHGCVFEAEWVEKAYVHAEVDDDGIKRVNCFNAKGNGVVGNKEIHRLARDQFAYDLTYHKRLMTAIMPHFLKASLDPTVLAGLKAVKDSMIETRMRMMQASLQNQMSEVISGKATKEQLAQSVLEMADKYKLS